MTLEYFAHILIEISPKFHSATLNKQLLYHSQSPLLVLKMDIFVY